MWNVQRYHIVIQDEEYCIGCDDEWFADNGICLNCTEETTVCKTCTSREICQSCIIDYNLDGTTCVPCDPNCVSGECDGLTGRCYQC